MMFPVSAFDESNDRPEAEPEDEQSILANLPHTRPQRSSPRRAAARAAAAKPAPAAQAQSPARSSPARTKAAPGAQRAAAKGAGKKAGSARRERAGTRAGAGSHASAGTRAGGGTRAGAPRRKAPRAGEPVPRQGYESELDRARGPVHPPGGAELVGSAVEIIGELAKSGLSTGERLVRDALARLPLS